MGKLLNYVLSRRHLSVLFTYIFHNNLSEVFYIYSNCIQHVHPDRIHHHDDTTEKASGHAVYQAMEFTDYVFLYLYD